MTMTESLKEYKQRSPKERKKIEKEKYIHFPFKFGVKVNKLVKEMIANELNFR